MTFILGLIIGVAFGLIAGVLIRQRIAHRDYRARKDEEA